MTANGTYTVFLSSQLPTSNINSDPMLKENAKCKQPLPQIYHDQFISAHANTNSFLQYPGNTTAEVHKQRMNSIRNTNTDRTLDTHTHVALAHAHAALTLPILTMWLQPREPNFMNLKNFRAVTSNTYTIKSTQYTLDNCSTHRS